MFIRTIGGECAVKTSVVALAIGASVWGSVLVSCDYKAQKSGMGDGDVPIEAADFHEPDFNVIMTKVIKPRCLECHSAAGGNKGGLNFESYEVVYRSRHVSKSSIEINSMPQNRAPLSPDQKRLFLTWLQDGAPEKRGVKPISNPIPPNQDLPLNYATVSKLVIADKCLTCHSAANPKGKCPSSPNPEEKVKLESYADVLKNVSCIGKDVEEGSMPKRDSLSEWQKDLILGWLAIGAPENSNQLLPTKGMAGGSQPDGKKTPGKPVQPLPRSEEASIARGKYLFNLSSCANCHTQDPAKPLAGGKSLITPFGTFFVPNISPAPKTGIGLWSKWDFIRALRWGIKPNGERYWPVFPFSNYSKMSLADILSIREYIMTLPATEQENRPHQINFTFNIPKYGPVTVDVSNQRWLLNFWRLLNFPIVKYPNLSNYRLAQGPYKEIMSESLAWNEGARLVEGPLHCTQCHTPRDEMGGLIVDKWFAGSAVSGGSSPAPNITPDPETGLKGWTRDTWDKFLSTGITPRGEKVSGEMWHVIKDATSQLTPNDKAAVIEYLMAIPSVSNPEIAELIRRLNPDRKPESEKRP